MCVIILLYFDVLFGRVSPTIMSVVISVLHLRNPNKSDFIQEKD